MIRLCLALFSTFLIMALTGCASTSGPTQLSPTQLSLTQLSPTQLSPNNAQTSKAFFEVYAQRQNFDQLMSFYANDAVLEDLIYGHHAKDKNAIAAFLNWSSPQFKLAANVPALVVQKQVTQGNTSVTQGYFNPFSWQQKPMGPWRFIIWLEFDDNGKIIREVDWINYTPRKDFLGGPNMNVTIEAAARRAANSPTIPPTPSSPF